MIKLTSLLAATALIASATVAYAGEAADRGWTIGPVIWGKNYSVGMPATPSRLDGDDIAIDFPRRGGHVHYVTFDPGSLADKREIVMRYRIDAERGARLVSQETPGEPATISFFFQRRGDDWKGRGDYQFYRWYAPSATVRELAPGRYEMRASFDDGAWRSVNGQASGDYLRQFQDAMADSSSIGFVMGTQRARGHGVYATAPARLVVTDFEIR